MPDPVAVWHSEHVRFARLLDFLERQMAAFHEGEDPDYALMRDAVHYLHHYADRFHHPPEDAAFRLMIRRDPALQLPINRLLQEHRVIAEAGDALLKCLNDILEDSVMRREAVEAAAATYLVYYRHHLQAEETDILPRAAELLTAGDWAEVAATVPPGRDPLFGDIGERYRELRERIRQAEA